MTENQIAAAARTIEHLGSYLIELQAAATDLGTRAEVADRGYFSVAEEHQARQLQVSYWQSRCALFELIESLRLEHQQAEDSDDRLFLLAFAAALLLVDAAMFMRENFHHLSAVRHKLDEPAEEFGIPPHMYKQVQRSLTNPRHAWHLYHASQYFQQNEESLSQLVCQTSLTAVWATIERLRHRLDVPLTTFAKARLRVRTRGLGARVSEDVFGRALYGLQKVVSELMSDIWVRRGHQPSLPAEIREQMSSLLAPGDVFIVRKEYALTNYFLPGYWPHAALYLGTADELQTLGVDSGEHVQPRWSKLAGGDEEPRRVLESMKDGVQIRSVDSPLASDSVVVVRPQLESAQIAAAISKGMVHEGKPYDFDFDFNRSDRLVCTEVVYRTYDGIGGINIELHRRAGRNTLAAGDLLRMAIAGQHFNMVAVYSPAHGSQVLRGDAAVEVVRQEEGEA